eukprot:gene1049-2057_t
MPRLKIVPVKRLSHRFESQEPNNLDIINSATRQDRFALSDNESKEVLANMSPILDTSVSEHDYVHNKSVEIGTILTSSYTSPTPAQQIFHINIDNSPDTELWTCIGIHSIPLSHVDSMIITTDLMLTLISNHNSISWILSPSLVRAIKTSLRHEIICFSIISHEKRCYLKISAAISSATRSSHKSLSLPIFSWATGDAHPSWLRNDSIQFDMNSFMQHLVDDCMDNVNTDAQTVDDLETLKTELKEQGLLPELRPYQLRGIQWMLDRENIDIEVDLLGLPEEQAVEDEVEVEVEDNTEYVNNDIESDVDRVVNNQSSSFSSSDECDDIDLSEVSLSGFIPLPYRPRVTRISQSAWEYTNGINENKKNEELFNTKNSLDNKSNNENYDDHNDENKENPSMTYYKDYDNDNDKYNRIPDTLKTWYSLLTGATTTIKPSATSIVRGGVLADEMGLGKTCQVIGLLLAAKNRKLSEQSAFDVRCGTVETKLECKEESFTYRQDVVEEADEEKEKEVVDEKDINRNINKPLPEDNCEEEEAEWEDDTVVNNSVVNSKPSKPIRSRSSRVILDDDDEDDNGGVDNDAFHGKVTPTKLSSMLDLDILTDSDNDDNDDYFNKKSSQRKSRKRKLFDTVTDEEYVETGKKKGRRKMKEKDKTLLSNGRHKRGVVSNEDDGGCHCGHVLSRRLDIGWIQCDLCSRWWHLKCAGFNSEEGASGTNVFECSVCASVRMFSEPIRSDATLIVVPTPLLQQWEAELSRHLKPDSLKVYIYNGTATLTKACKTNPNRMKELHPLFLSEHDVVLTTFEVLAEELAQTESPYIGIKNFGTGNHTRKFFDEVDLEAPRSLRRPKKYIVVPSILACVDWHRLILDEAQMIQGSYSVATKMALRLSSQIKWCVTGTPLGSGKLTDLSALLVFLGQSPLNDADSWRRLIGEGTTPLANRILRVLCSHLFLRRTKDIVEKELALPTQTEKITYLRFNCVEAHFYKSIHQDCLHLLSSVKSGIQTDKGRKQFDALGVKVLALRQACCHPQIGAKGFQQGGRRLGAGGLTESSSVMSMDAILSRLMDGVRTKCEEAQRLQLMALCGMAGVARIQAMRSEKEDKEEKVLEEKQGEQGGNVYLLSAADAYERAVEVFKSNRQECPMIGTVILRGDGALEDGNRQCVADNISLSWRNTNNNNSLLSESAYSSHDDSAVSGEIRAERIFGDLDAVHVRFELRNSRRVTRALILPDTAMLLKRLTKEKFEANQQITTAMKPIYVSGYVVCFPKQVSVQCVVAGGGVYVEAHGSVLRSPLQEILQRQHSGYDITSDTDGNEGIGWNVLSAALEHSSSSWQELRGKLSHTTSTNTTTSTSDVDPTNETILSFRSKNWRFQVASIHALGLYCVNGSASIIDLRKERLEGRNPSVWMPIRLQLKEPEFDVDPLQEFHIAHNYSEVLAQIALLSEEDDTHHSPQDISQEGNGSGNENKNTMISNQKDTLVSVMRDRANFLRSHYLRTAKEVRASGKFKLKEAIDTTTKHTPDELGLWWIALLRSLSRPGEGRAALGRKLLHDIQKLVETSEQAYRSAVPRLPKETSGLVVLLMSLTNELEAARKRIIQELDKLPDDPSKKQVNECGNCRKCRSYLSRTGPVCHHCKLEDVISEFEEKLFAFRRQTKRKAVVDGKLDDDDAWDVANQQRGAFQMDGPGIQICNILLRFMTAHENQLEEACTDFNIQWAISAARVESQRYSSMQKELVVMRGLWRQHFQLLSAWDELSMAAVPLRSVTADTLVAEGELSSVVIQGDEEARYAQYETDCEISRAELQQKQGQLRYLRNVDSQRRDDSADAGEGGGQCAICMEDLRAGGDVCVIGCGHSYHKDCIDFICKKQMSNKSIKCPECRRVSSPSEFILVADGNNSSTGNDTNDSGSNNASTVDISVEKGGEGCRIVDTARSPLEARAAVTVEGQWGTKVTAFVTDLLSLPADHKAVVFSQWSQMLDIAAAALSRNNIRFERFEGRKSCQGALTRFRTDASVRALLLPLKSGAQGLTLVEASHVFLLEPLLNPAQEAQAVNRVHRIGQTRPSIVHRYIIKGTIEEKINDMRCEHLQTSEKSPASIASSAKPSIAKKGAKGGDDQSELSEDAVRKLLD